MPICFMCKEELCNVQLLRIHFEYKHKEIKHYDCAELNCHRKFDTFESLQKHLNLYHNMQQPQRSINQGNGSNNEHNINYISNYDLHNDNDSLEIGNSDLNTSDSDDDVLNHDNSFNFEEHSFDKIASFFAKLLCNYGLPRNHVQNLYKEIKTLFFDDCLGEIEKFLSSNQNVDDSKIIVDKIQSFCKNYKNSFESMSTEFRRIKYFTNSGQYIPPKSYIIQHGTERIVSEVGQFISLRQMLEHFFQIPNALENILSNINLLNSSDKIYSYMQTDTWKRKLLFYRADDIVLPLMLYFDDFESNNPLGPKSGKLGVVYAQLLCLPPECQFTSDNIFLILIFESISRKNFGNRKVFAPLIEELNFLANEGISVINNHEEIKKIYFTTEFFTGDNLGINSIFGFVESFNAYHYCRVCKNLKQNMQIQYKDDISYQRNPQNYEEDVSKKNEKLTGIKERSIFNQLGNFHVTLNSALDPMHDLAEGICHYDMCYIIKHCIECNYFSLDQLNTRMSVFNYGPIDKSSEPPFIFKKHLDSLTLKMTATQTLCFVKYFGLLIGDLVPDNDSFWLLYRLLREIIDIVFAKNIHKNYPNILQVLVSEHHKLYLQITNDNLKPKYHILVHYPLFMKRAGPVSQFSCFKFEAKHKFLKKSAFTNSCKKNKAYSVAVKHQLHMCYRFLSSSSILQTFSTGPLKKMNQFKKIQILASLPNNIKNNSNLTIRKWINYKGTCFHDNLILVIDENECGPLFGAIDAIIVCEYIVIFHCKILITIGFNEHIRGYEVRFSESKKNINIDDLHDPLPLSLNTNVLNENYIIMRYAI